MLGPARRRRRFVFSYDYMMESRVLLSSGGERIIDTPSVRLARVAHVGRAAAHVGVEPARAASRIANHRLPAAAGAALFPTVRRWSWLANTSWYVPTANLPAVLYNSATGSQTIVSDQTVFHITGYVDGYFWGDTVTQLGSSAAVSSTLLGSVTPQGKVLLTFTQTSSSSSPSITNGFGTMQRKLGKWTMENQMFTSPAETVQIGHWAYMVQTRPGLPSWTSLPPSGESVPEFLYS
jgi:hypothetical protein